MSYILWLLMNLYNYAIDLGERPGPWRRGEWIVDTDLTTIECTIKSFIKGPEGKSEKLHFDYSIFINDV